MILRISTFLVCLSLLLFATHSSAQPCLEVSAVDQRQLAALRAVVEESCPCESYDGSAGAKRADYEDCAVALLDAALASGDLRGSCSVRAYEMLDATTCGTGNIACARISPLKDPVSSCRIVSEGSCRSRTAVRRELARTSSSSSRRVPVRSGPRSRSGGYVETACAEQTHCADVQQWTAGTCFDVREEGPYEAGVRVLSLTKPSEVDGSPRQLETVVWYPAPAGSGDRDSLYDAVMDAPIDSSAGPRPILLFSHGSCGFERQSLFLTPWLATHGFVVVAPPHPGNTLFEYPACGNSENTGASAVERPADMVFVLDAILAQNGDSASPFSGSLDPDAIGMSGHSFGGFTTFRTAERDDRIKVVIPLAASAPADGRFDIPSLSIIGDVDSVVSNARNVAAYERSANPKWLVNILHTGHYAFSDSCFPGPDCEPPLVLEQQEANELVRRWMLPFVKVFLEGDSSFEPFLDHGAGPSFAVDVGLARGPRDSRGAGARWAR